MNKTNIYILGASFPKAGEKPSVLQQVDKRRTVLDWQMLSFREIINKKINFLGGYKFNDIKQQGGDINYLYVENWRSSSILDTFFECPLENTSAIFTYADTIFRDYFLQRLSSNEADITIAIDLNYRNRYYNRSKADLDIAETIIPKKGPYAGISAEFTGLFHVRPKIISIIKSLKGKLVGKSLLDLISHLQEMELNIDFIDVKNEWTELNEPEDLARFILGSKSRTLNRLENVVKKSKIGRQFCFSVRDWNDFREKMIANIQECFLEKQLIVRSSTSLEDGWDSSNAGKYKSVLNVDSSSSILIGNAIDEVISSYGDMRDIRDDEVLVQEYLDDFDLSGVALTCRLETGAPYFTYNFQDNQGAIDRITSGISHDDRIIISYNSLDSLKNLEPKLVPVQSALEELKKLLFFDKLDVEFGIDNQGLVYILQVRPITVDHRSYDDSSDYFNEGLNDLANDFKSFQSSSTSLLGKKVLFSNMSDWNPAEIIGTHPNPMAFSLYKFLITDEIWAKQRSEFGYREINNHPLMVSFKGKPYIDLRASFNSFIPKNINDKLAQKLVNAYIDDLSLNPEFHDKIEFEVAFTSWTPSFLEQADKRLIPNGFSPKEVSNLEKELKDLTLSSIFNFDKYKMNEDLAVNRAKILNSDMNYINKFRSLVIDCRENGTLRFAHAARHGFIAVSLLKSLTHEHVFTKNEIDEFMSSINGVSSKIRNDQIDYMEGNILLEEMIEKYGHLRPGTYDASTLAYWENPEYYLKSEKVLKKSASNTFKLTKKHYTAIKELFKNTSFDISPELLMLYIEKAIVFREEAKLEFTRNLSYALDCLVSFGNQIGISRDEIVFLNYCDIESINNKKINLDNIKKLIESRILIHKSEELYELPMLIDSEDDFYAFEQFDAQINFITNKKVVGELKNLNIKTNDNIKGKIILIKQADPGYDWVFTSNIAGLITEYGGSNSHMAIRAAELGLPAAIGVGNKMFNKLLKTNKIKLDCGNHNIIIIN